jgi:transketolase
MAIAGRWLAARYNKPGLTLFDYRVWAQCSDGDLMEGVSCEAASLAGHLQLDNLCWIYDDNQITIEGQTKLAFSEDVATRFRGLGWHVLEVDDANDLAALDASYRKVLKHRGSPTLIVVKSVIGYGAPTKAGTADAHGAALGAKEIAATKSAYGWPADAQFLVPPEVPEHFQSTLGARGQQARKAWGFLLAKYANEFPELATELKQIQAHELPKGWQDARLAFDADAKGLATRVSGGKVLNAFAKRIPWVLGGSADLAPSTKTLLTFDDAGGDVSADNPGGRNLRFGVREHAMAAAVNGMVLCGLRAYAATFFVFSDYCRPSLRLAAIMGIPSITVFTHDSIGVGEDGPTHQPIEHLAACRAIPRMIVLRPGDANEVAFAWQVALEQTDRPVLLVLTRQDLPTLDRAKYAPAEGVTRGGYVLADARSRVSPKLGDPKLGDGSFGETALREPDVILMATGSELQLAVAAHEQLAASGIHSRVVSLPSFELFDEQPSSYRDEVLPPQVTARIAIEAGVRQCWDKYLGTAGAFIGLDTFGASAPYQSIFEHRGLTADAVVAKARELCRK